MTMTHDIPSGSAEPDCLFVYQERGTPLTEPFCLKLTGDRGQPLAWMKVVLTSGDQRRESVSDAEGYVDLDLSDLAETLQGELTIFRDAADEAPYRFEVHIAYLDPVDTPRGIQSRCNLLGFDCGAVDGRLGDATRRAVRAFQAAAGLTEDGEAGPETRAELVRVCGL